MAVFIVVVAVIVTAGNRLLFEILMQIMTVSSGVRPLLADTAFVSLGLMLGYAVMRLIAGPARADPFARRS